MKALRVTCTSIIFAALCIGLHTQFAQGAPVESETVGPQKMLVALFNFSDVPNRPFTLDSVKAKILNDAKSVNNFLKENSYNKTELDPNNLAFVDWITIQANSLEVCPGST